jgi:hypothetical protein
MSELPGPEPAAWAAKTADGRLEYWRELWEDLVTFRNHFRGLSAKNPHVLLREILCEIEDGFPNKHSFQFLQKELNDFVKADPALRADPSAFQLLLQEFAKRRRGHLRAICDAALRPFTMGEYSRFHCKELERILLEPKPRDGYSNLLFTSETLIVELVGLGYSWPFIAAMPSAILAGYRKIGGHVDATYPHELSSELFRQQDGALDRAGYEAALERMLENLTPADRLARFAKYFSPRRDKSYYVFQVEGLRPDYQDPDHELDIGNVTLYWPYNRKFLAASEGPLGDADEAFGLPQDSAFINAAVSVDRLACDREAGLEMAVQDAERAIDLVSAYIAGPRPYRINRDSYRIGDDAKRLAGSTFYFPSDQLRFAESTNLKDVKLSLRDERLTAAAAIQSSMVDTRCDTEKRLVWGFRWLRKAEEATRSEDTLLFSWVVIETLLGSDDPGFAISADGKPSQVGRAMEIIPAVDVKYLRWAVLRVLRARLRQAVHSVPRQTELPPALSSEAGLDMIPYQTYNLGRFLQVIPQLRVHLSGRRLDDWLAHAQRFFSDPKFAAEAYERRLRTLRDQVALIYRLRNRIVHSANYEHPFMSYHADQARHLAEAALKTVFDAYSRNTESTVSDVLARVLTDVQLLIERLKAGEKLDLLADELW